MDRALKVLDHIPPYDTHKIGVIYVDMEQVRVITVQLVRCV